MVNINSIYTFFRENERLLLYVSLLLCVVFWHRSCESKPEKEIITIEVPAKEGSFETSDPVEHQSINIDSIQKEMLQSFSPKLKRLRNQALSAQQKNKDLLRRYDSLQEDYEKYKLFKSFIEPKKFKQNFEDVHLSAQVTGVVRGELESLDMNYKIKPQKINHEIEKPSAKRFSVGPYFGYDLLNTQPSIGISINYGLIRF